MNAIESLFLSQSCQDAWDDYARSLKRPGFPRWDVVALTASNERQAEGFRAQLAAREQAGLLPEGTKFLVLPDPEGKRVGSGGATLNVLRAVAELSGENFAGKRILTVHSGGDSRRVPQYSALGKLFSPVPRLLPDGRASTLFDEMLIAMSGVPGRIRDGMLLLSGDVLLLFNALQIDFAGRGAAAISFKARVETGKNHGVFRMGEDGSVAEFLHKQPEETLRAHGAVNEAGNVDIDTGAVLFSSELLTALYGLISEDGAFSKARFDAYVNDRVRLSLYGDFLYPLASESTLEGFYREQPEGTFCEELTACRTQVWRALRPFRMKLLRLSPSKFVHFGTTGEVAALMAGGVDAYAHLGWSRQVNSCAANQNAAAYNSVLSRGAECGAGAYLESSYVHSGARIGAGAVVSGVELENEAIPAGVVLHGLKLDDGRFVARIYGVNDNPKGSLEENGAFLGAPMRDFLARNGLSEEELWPGEAQHTLWLAKLYPACATMREAVRAALNVYEMARGCGDASAWRAQARRSLSDGFGQADPQALIAWNRRMEELVWMERLRAAIRAGESADACRERFRSSGLSPLQRRWLENAAKEADFGEKMRLYHYLGRIIGGAEGERLADACFASIRAQIVESARVCEDTSLRMRGDMHRVCLPLRVNFGGGWSDTPPQCVEMGGTVLNAAIELDGRRPVQVTLKRLAEKKIVFDSRDMDSHGEFSDIEPLQRVGDPYDPFALQKAALLACGVLPALGGRLETALDRLGGGLFMSTEVVGVPKGSGLGTSSILAAACVRALYEFMGADACDERVIERVLCMEQMMSTGGGWQDQVGGLSGGVKYITAAPGLPQRPKCTRIELDARTLAELNDRLALIYTGQRRLARNLLRDVVGRYIGGVPEATGALEEMQRIAALMRFELERGSVDGFAALLTRHWALAKQLDAGSTNTCIDQIFLAVDDLIDGRMVCGAGGGGFLQVILKKGVGKDALRARLREVFQDSGAAVWDAKIV